MFWDLPGFLSPDAFGREVRLLRELCTKFACGDMILRGDGSMRQFQGRGTEPGESDTFLPSAEFKAAVETAVAQKLTHAKVHWEFLYFRVKGQGYGTALHSDRSFVEEETTLLERGMTVATLWCLLEDAQPGHSMLYFGKGRTPTGARAAGDAVLFDIDQEHGAFMGKKSTRPRYSFDIRLTFAHVTPVCEPVLKAAGRSWFLGLKELPARIPIRKLIVWAWQEDEEVVSDREIDPREIDLELLPKPLAVTSRSSAEAQLSQVKASLEKPHCFAAGAAAGRWVLKGNTYYDSSALAPEAFRRLAIPPEEGPEWEEPFSEDLVLHVIDQVKRLKNMLNGTDEDTDNNRYVLALALKHYGLVPLRVREALQAFKPSPLIPAQFQEYFAPPYETSRDIPAPNLEKLESFLASKRRSCEADLRKFAQLSWNALSELAILAIVSDAQDQRIAQHISKLFAFASQLADWLARCPRIETQTLERIVYHVAHTLTARTMYGTTNLKPIPYPRAGMVTLLRQLAPVLLERRLIEVALEIAQLLRALDSQELAFEKAIAAFLRAEKPPWKKDNREPASNLHVITVLVTAAYFPPLLRVRIPRGSPKEETQ